MIQTLIEPDAKRSTQVFSEEPKEKRKSILVRLREFDWKGSIKKFFSKETMVTLQKDGKTVMSLLSFLGLVMIFLIESTGNFLFSIINFRHILTGKTKFWETKWGFVIEKIVNVLETRAGVKRTFLIGLAFRNMKVKKMRSVVTVGGVSLGIAAIVFLVSLGYGVQRLVVSRVARLDDLKMADILLGKSTLLKLDDNAINTIGLIDKVEKVMPIVSVVGNVDFKGSTSEVVAYAVTGDYLKVSNLNLLSGDLFETEKLSAAPKAPEVAGASTEWKFVDTEMNAKIRNVNVNILEGEWMRVREEPSTDSKVLGYARRYEGGYDGEEVWGGTYVSTGTEGKSARNSKGEYLGKWIKAPFILFEKDGDDYKQIVDNNLPDWREGYIAELTDIVTIDGLEIFRVSGEVLGDSTESGVIVEQEPSEEVLGIEDTIATIAAKVVGVDSSGVEWVEIEGGDLQGLDELTLQYASNAQKIAIVNKAFLDATGIDPSKAVGEVFRVSLLISKAVKSDLDRSARSENVEYKIGAVFDGGNSPMMYIPLNDVVGLGVNNYSQAKLLVKSTDDLQKVRTTVDGYGYQTSSVADTVAQIDKMFATVRLVLASFGMVALAVASLGMFNTMTVSLMERTHEVGVMKAMGMLSSEVKELFMAEAMVMGIMGGVLGVTFGYLAGKILGLILSVFSLTSGIGWINVSYIPIPFVIIILLLSFVVGVSTGIYPARRATKISALDALRYE